MEKENSRWQKERRELAGINAFDVEFVELSEIEKYFPKKG